MKPIIKIVLILLLQLISYNTYSQASTWIMTNPAVGTSKGTMNGLLLADQGLTITQIGAVEALKKQEEDYQEALKFDKKVLLTIAATQASIEGTYKMGKDVRDEIKKIKLGKLFFRQGIKKLESDLEKEIKYLEQIRKESGYIFVGGVAGTATGFSGGGSGYYFTAIMKIMLRNTEIRRNILDIRMEVHNKRTNNKIFKK